MTLRETIVAAHELLARHGIDHALIGGIALASLGAHRATKDVDFLIEASDSQKVRAAFSKNAFRLTHESEDVLQFSGAGNVDFLLAHRPMSLAMLRSAQPLPPFGIKCVSLEGIVGLKIQAYCNDRSREFQDKADIVALLKASKTVDWEVIQGYANLFGEWAEIERIRNMLPRGAT